MTRATPPSKEDIQKARDEGLSRQQIADRLGSTLPTIKRLITAYGLAKTPAQEPTTVRKREEIRTPLEQAKTILGKRLGEDHRGYLLDGRPASSMQVLRAAGLAR